MPFKIMLYNALIYYNLVLCMPTDIVNYNMKLKYQALNAIILTSLCLYAILYLNINIQNYIPLRNCDTYHNEYADSRGSVV